MDISDFDRVVFGGGPSGDHARDSWNLSPQSRQEARADYYSGLDDDELAEFGELEQIEQTIYPGEYLNSATGEILSRKEHRPNQGDLF